MGRLLARGILDDVRLARRLAEANAGRRTISLDALRRRCAERGAAPEALAALDGPEAPPEALLARFRPAERAKAGRFLAARGFEPEAIEAALDARFGPGASE